MVPNTEACRLLAGRRPDGAADGGSGGSGGGGGWGPLVAQARWLCCMPEEARGALAIFLAGCACGAACLQGLQVFFPAISVEIGLWIDEVDAAMHFGGGIVCGAVFGGVLHGLVAERFVSRLGAAVRSAHPALEARVIILIVSFTMATGSVLAVGLSRCMAAHLANLSLVGIVLCGALLLGSLGLQVRTPLLLVPTAYRPAAIFMGTLAGYVGEFSGPPVVGILKDALAPLCKTIEVDGEQVVDPRCAASAADQRGLGTVLFMPSLLALAASLLFLWSATVIRKPACCAPAHDVRRASSAAGAASYGDEQERRSTELEERFSGLGATRDLYRSPAVA